MNRILIFVLTLIILVFTSCGEVKQPKYYLDTEVKTFSIENTSPLENIIIDEIQIEREVPVIYYDLAANDSLLFLLNESEPYLKVYNWKKDSVLWEGFKYGRGPMDFETPSEVLINSYDNTVDVIDLTLRRISKLPVNYFGEKIKKELELEYIFLPKKIGLITNFEPFFSDYIVTGFFNDLNRYSVIANDSSVTNFGTLPEFDKSMAPHVLQQAYTSFPTFSEYREKIAFANRHSNLLEIYTSQGNLLSSTVGREYFRPVFEEGYINGNKVFMSGSELTFGFIDIDSDSSFIYTIFSGKKREEGQAYAADYMLIFNWDGNLQYKIKLKHKALRLSSIKNKNIIMTINNDLNNPITKYRINK